MNKMLVGFVFLLFVSCLNKNNKTTGINNAETIENNKSDTITALNIPTYNFNELEPLLHQKNDTTYIVNFWATWCKPCIEELPAFEKINKQYASQKVKVLLVSLDFPRHFDTKLVPYVKKHQIKSEVVLLDDPDANGWIPKVSEEWSGAIPATLIYKGAESKFFERSFTYEEIELELQSILNK